MFARFRQKFFGDTWLRASSRESMRDLLFARIAEMIGGSIDQGMDLEEAWLHIGENGVGLSYDPTNVSRRPIASMRLSDYGQLQTLIGRYFETEDEAARDEIVDQTNEVVDAIVNDVLEMI